MDASLTEEIQRRLEAASQHLKTLGYHPLQITPREFHDYLTGETLTGDTTPLDAILSSDYLMLHELVELSELKQRGILIHHRTFLDNPDAVYEVHLTATEYEFRYALHQKDYAWVRSRIHQAACWFDDPHLPQHLIPQYQALLDRFTAALPAEE